MNTASNKTKVKEAKKLNRGPFAKFVNRRNAMDKAAVPTVKPKIASTIHTK